MMDDERLLQRLLYLLLAMTFAQTSSKFADLPVEALLYAFTLDKKFTIPNFSSKLWEEASLTICL